MTKINYVDVKLIPLHEIKEEVLQCKQHEVCEHMAAAGMYSDEIDYLYELISMCIANKNEWIRNAGFICMYHINYRYKLDLDETFLVKNLKLGLNDPSETVRSTVSDILDYLEEFNNSAWQKICAEK